MTPDSEFFLRHSLLLRNRCLLLEDFCASWKIEVKRTETIEGSVRQYIREVLNRILQLSQDTIFLMNSDRPIAASMCARGSMETAGVLVEFFRKLQSAVIRRDGPSALSVVRNFMFASMEFGSEYSVSTPHVLNGIRALDSKIVGIETTYNILCETVHPNWAGRFSGDDSGDAVGKKSVERIYVSIFILADVIETICKSASDFAVFLNDNRSVMKKLKGAQPL